jgi:hypothetical protein
MKGPRPNPAIAFRELYKAATRLRGCSETSRQNSIIDSLVAGLRAIEPAWNVRRSPDGNLDLLNTHPYNSKPIPADETAINPDG